MNHPIHKDRIYPLPLFKKITGLGDSAFRNAEKAGLVSYKVGNRKFVEGAAFFEFLKTQSGVNHD